MQQQHVASSMPSGIALRSIRATRLLVEDNEMNRDMLSRRLERKGHEVVVAVDGQAGVDMASLLFVTI